ncbi:Uncharacterised protein [Enterococcus casseliflavus]|uniref:hypothetical protein n=1 Tax=Enterococcus casseliflavus TaxID=37734 RepID=UPI000E01AF3B|nr:hypothetical protein [Enterococcus casseliflavus]GEB28735.1 hypothetical protein ECA02_18300 [Enterococcus casseliflavus]STP33482.1 Uncharacterised protein [Enterococcus casseliflavus]
MAKTDDRKVLNRVYNPKEDSYINPKGGRFNFHAYRQRTDMDEFIRDFKKYQSEKTYANQAFIPEALTPKGNLRKITVHLSWKYHKEKQEER